MSQELSLGAAFLPYTIIYFGVVLWEFVWILVSLLGLQLLMIYFLLMIANK